MTSFVQGRRANAAAATASIFDQLLQAPAIWMERISTRRELAELSEDQIRDAGLDRTAILRESSKSFWQA